MIGWIIWGTGGDIVDLGVVEHKHCEICERERPFKILLQYRYAHLYWIFSWVSEKKYLLLCDVCQRGWNLKTADVEKNLSKNPIPFLRRWGWAFLIAPFAIVFLSGFIRSFFR